MKRVGQWMQFCRKCRNTSIHSRAPHDLPVCWCCAAIERAERGMGDGATNG